MTNIVKYDILMLTMELNVSKLLNFFMVFAIIVLVSFIAPFMSEWVAMTILTVIGFLILFVLMSFIL